MSNVVANTILNQIGGRRFIMMTGAKNFVASEKGITFRLPARSAKQGINKVRIVLMPDDTYEMQFIKYANMMDKRISTSTGVYCDMLEDIFESQTGLYTSIKSRSWAE